jgi:hypothetical protein
MSTTTLLIAKARALGLPESGTDDAPSFTLCQSPPGCCPVVTELADGGLRIEDEGQTITMTAEQRALFRQIA